MRPFHQWAWLGALTLLVTLGGCAPAPAPGWAGYVEGDYVYLGSALGGTLTTLAVRPGAQAQPGVPLFTLDSDAELAAQAEADARLARARAQAGNLAKGRRSDELDVVRAQLTQARSLAEQTQSDLAREEQLLLQGFVAPARRDTLRSALAVAQARVDELQAALRVAQLPARADEQAAARAETEAATQAVRQLAWRSAQKTRAAPVAALVADTYFRVGEWVAPGQPVLALLPPGHVKLRFYVAQGDLPRVPVGSRVLARCDGCNAPVAATVSFVATRAEYTPPVIYSNAQRAKLVFLVEARPDAADAMRLQPGQPVDVAPAAGTP